MSTEKSSHASSTVVLKVYREQIRAGGYTVNVIRAGANGASGACFVWLPALMDSASSFTRAALQLTRRLQATTRIHAIDPPGYGMPALDTGGRIPTFEELGMWLNTLLDQLPGPFILAGNSSGAVMAAAAAARRDVLGLALIGWCDWRLIGTPHRELLCPSTDAELRGLLALGWHRPPLLLPQTMAAQLAYAQRPDYREHVASFSPQAFGAAFDRYSGPLALVVGDSDSIITPTMVSALARRRPGSELHIIEACGHYPHREQPRALAEILARFCTDLLRRYGLYGSALHCPDVPSMTH